MISGKQDQPIKPWKEQPRAASPYRHISMHVMSCHVMSLVIEISYSYPSGCELVN